MKVTCSMCTAKHMIPHSSPNLREPPVCLLLACRQETLLGISNATNQQLVDYLTDFSKLGTSRTDPDQEGHVEPHRGKTVFSQQKKTQVKYFSGHTGLS